MDGETNGGQQETQEQEAAQVSQQEAQGEHEAAGRESTVRVDCRKMKAARADLADYDDMDKHKRAEPCLFAR